MISSVDIEQRTYSRQAFQGKGFEIARKLFSSDEYDGKKSKFHVIQLNDGPPFELSWKSETQLTKTICESGNFIQLLAKASQHSLSFDGKCPTIELSFDGDFIEKIAEKENFVFCHRHNFHDPLLNLLIRQLFTASRSQVSENLFIESLAIACAIHLTTTYALNSRKVFSLKGKLSSHQLKSVIMFIRDSINRTVTLEELANCCHLSVFHFSRLFKNTLGISP